MSGTPVRIAHVVADPALTAKPARMRYRVTLLCGCHWWEDHNPATPPATTEIAWCFAPHSATILGVPPSHRGSATSGNAERAPATNHDGLDR
jgi:hypothetical protein